MQDEPVIELLRAIRSVQLRYIEDAEPHDVFDGLLESLLTLTGSEYGFIGEVLQSQEGLPYLRTQAISDVAWNEETRRFYQENAPNGLEFHNLDTLFGAVMTSRQPVLANDPAHDPRAGGLPPGHPPLRAFLGLPLVVHETMVGMIGIANRAQGYDAALVEYLEPLTGTCAGLVRAYRNARERKRAELERRAAEEQMRHVQKLESLGVLAGGIAHDFNNLLMGILGNAEVALQDVDPSSPLQPLIDEVHRSASQAAELTHQLLAYTGKAATSVETFDLSQLVAEMATLVRAAVPHSAELRIQTEGPGFLWIQADATQVRQLVMNLVTNASESLGDGPGAVEVKTGIVELDPEELAECFVLGQPGAGSWIGLEVRDSGAGMSAETVERIFDPFYSTKGDARGLGLAVASGIVRSHEAVLVVNSAPGTGTTFRVAFRPAAGPASRAVPTREAGSGHDWEGGGTVLVVDDEPAVARSAARMLVKLGLDDARHGRRGHLSRAEAAPTGPPPAPDERAPSGGDGATDRGRGGHGLPREALLPRRPVRQSASAAEILRSGQPDRPASAPGRVRGSKAAGRYGADGSPARDPRSLTSGECTRASAWARAGPR
jgi:signal transduction histidine kinase